MKGFYERVSADASYGSALEGAAYHVMARGNHRGKIVFDDEDRRTFIKTLEETAEMTGWEVYFLDSRAYLARRWRQPVGSSWHGVKISGFNHPGSERRNQ